MARDGHERTGVVLGDFLDDGIVHGRRACPSASQTMHRAASGSHAATPQPDAHLRGSGAGGLRRPAFDARSRRTGRRVDRDAVVGDAGRRACCCSGLSLVLLALAFVRPGAGAAHPAERLARRRRAGVAGRGADAAAGLRPVERRAPAGPSRRRGRASTVEAQPSNGNGPSAIPDAEGGRRISGTCLHIPAGRAGRRAHHQRRRDPQLLGAASRRQDRCHPRPCQRAAAHGRRSPASIAASAPSSAAPGMRHADRGRGASRTRGLCRRDPRLRPNEAAP